ncbi:unnamed protein product [Closterium sp. NIES-64]|nr:unnamed protein product [Closterium sp. NIES-64]
MSWLALGDSSARGDVQRQMRVSCDCGQIRDCCFGRAAAVTSSLDNMRAAAPCARLLFMAHVAIGSSGWRTTAATCVPLHYIACGGFCRCAPSPCHFGRPCASDEVSSPSPSSERERLQPASAPDALALTSAAPDGARLLLLTAHCCYFWRPTTATLGGAWLSPSYRAVLPNALAACTGAALALGGSGISSTCVTLVSSPSSA